MKSILEKSDHTPKTRLVFTYGYLTVFFVLLAGLFHPILTGADFTDVIVGTVVFFTGLVGGIFLYKTASSANRQAIHLVIGFGLAGISLACMLLLI